MSLNLSPEVFTILSALIEQRCGIHYRPADRELLAVKAAPRVLDAGFESFLDYYYYLRYDDPAGTEIDRLIESLVVGETYFFRELGQLQMLVERLVAPRIEAGRQVRLWSSACATGEEPLTLAMLLDQRGLLERTEIVATDVSARALSRAQAGRFGRRSLRQETVPPFAAAWLDVTDQGIAVAPGLVRRISWRRLNLLDAAAVAGLGTFDAILCRNVLIYFRDEVACQVAATLVAALAGDGALFVGVSESLMRFGGLVSCEEQDGEFFYRKVKR